MSPVATREKSPPAQALYVAFELGERKWKIACTTGAGQAPRIRQLDARDLARLDEEILLAKIRFNVASEAPVYTCYEAGREGFWLHRALVARGLDNTVVDSSSIEVNRRARRAKSDKLDAVKLVTMLIRYQGGETRVWHVVRVPTAAEEDQRQLHRELAVLKRDRTAVIDTQIRLLERRRKHELRHGRGRALSLIRKLMKLRGIGIESAWIYVMELFAWRELKNVRQVGALAGLTPSPYQSGDMNHERGISKAGNRHVRGIAIEIAWGWLQHQPQSELSRWYHSQFGVGRSAMRRKGIVALARKLLVALWKYTEHDELPAGAALKG